MSDLTDISNAEDGGGSRDGQDAGGGKPDDAIESYFSTDPKMKDICDTAATKIHEFEGTSAHKLVTFAVSQEVSDVSTEVNGVGYMIDMIDNFDQVSSVNVDIPKLDREWGLNETSKEQISIRMVIMPFIEGQITNARDSTQSKKAGICRYCTYRYLYKKIEQDDILEGHRSYRKIVRDNKKSMESDIERVRETFRTFLRFRFDVDKERTIELLSDGGKDAEIFATEYYDLFKGNAGYEEALEMVDKELLDNVEEVIEEALGIEE